MLRLAVTVVGEVLELSANAKAANVFLGGLGWNLQLFGYSKIGLAVEIWRKIVERWLFDNGWGLAICCRFVDGNEPKTLAVCCKSTRAIVMAV